MQIHDRFEVWLSHEANLSARIEVEHSNNPEILRLHKILKDRQDLSINMTKCRTSCDRITHTVEEVIEKLQEAANTPEIHLEEFVPDVGAEPREDVGEAVKELGWYWHEAGQLDSDEEEWDDQEQFEICGWGYDHYESAIYDDNGDHIDTYGWCYNSHGSSYVSRIERDEFMKRLAECRSYCQKYKGYLAYKAYLTAMGHVLREEDKTSELATW